MSNPHSAHLDTAASPEGGHGHGAHVLSRGTLLGTFGFLLVLTGVTIAVSRVDFGTLSVAVALFIAGCKAAAVGAIFMHLKWDRYFNRVALVGAIFFLVLFIGFVVFDTKQYQPAIRAWERDHPAAVSRPQAEASPAAAAHE